MCKVTDLTKKGKYYLVTIKDDISINDYKVSEDLVIEYRLLVGKEFLQAEMKKVLEAINKDAYYQKVLNYALFKPRTKKEIYSYLDKLKVTDYGYYLKKLENVKLINDTLYTENYINDCINFKRYGPRKIIDDLRTKGIDNDLIDKYLVQYSEKQINDNITYWLEKKLKTIKNQSFYKATKMVLNFLLNKGFDYEEVTNILSQNKDEIENQINEDEIIVKEIKLLQAKYGKKDLKVSQNQYIINKLLAKGYHYSIIKKHLEGSL